MQIFVVPFSDKKSVGLALSANGLLMIQCIYEFSYAFLSQVITKLMWEILGIF